MRLLGSGSERYPSIANRYYAKSGARRASASKFKLLPFLVGLKHVGRKARTVGEIVQERRFRETVPSAFRSAPALWRGLPKRGLRAAEEVRDVVASREPPRYRRCAEPSNPIHSKAPGSIGRCRKKQHEERNRPTPIRFDCLDVDVWATTLAAKSTAAPARLLPLPSAENRRRHPRGHFRSPLHYAVRSMRPKIAVILACQTSSPTEMLFDPAMPRRCLWLPRRN